MEKMGFTIKINVWAVALRCTRFHTNFIHTEIRRHFVGTFNWSKNLWKVMLFWNIPASHLHHFTWFHLGAICRQNVSLLMLVSFRFIQWFHFRGVIMQRQNKVFYLNKESRFLLLFLFLSERSKNIRQQINKWKGKQSFAVCLPVCFARAKA